MKNSSRKTSMLAGVLLLAAGPISNARADSVSATVDAQEIAVGQPTQLTVTVSGSQTQPSIPHVPGLEITPMGQSTQIEIVNGAMTANASDTYEVVPEREGNFVIPSIQAGNAASQPITLHVVNGSGPVASAPSASPSVSPNPSPSASMASTDAVDNAASSVGRFGSIQITLPPKTVYVGELIPVEIKAFIPDGLNATVTDLPQFTSDGLTLNSLSTMPDQTSQDIDGQPCTVMTWHSALTAVKSGTFSFSLKMPETVVVAQRMPRMNSGDDDGFDSFFRNAFASMGAMGRKKEVVLQSSADSLQVLPLPQENRPADFNGAVGQFQIEASARPTQVNAGDPVTLQLKVAGEGNFDRVSPSMLASDADWKTYSTKSSFEPADSDGYRGSKTFEQPVIPNRPGLTAVPSLSFSFFDPEKRQYVTCTAPPLPVTVGGTALSSAPAMNPSAPAPSSAVTATAGTGTELRPNEVDEGAFVSTLRPIFLNPWFVSAQGVPILALLLGAVLVRRKKRESTSDRVRATAAEQAIRRQVAAMDEAIRKSETDAFFIHARAALQERLGQKWNRRPETITLVDIEARTSNPGGVLRPVFEMADQASYSDLHFAQTDLREWKQAVLHELDAVEKN